MGIKFLDDNTKTNGFFKKPKKPIMIMIMRMRMIMKMIMVMVMRRRIFAEQISI